MAQLRPHLSPDEFLSRVLSQGSAGYRIAFVEDGGAVVAVAGFRESEMLAHGRFLYVDDLVTDGASRSHGYGAQLIQWLCDRAEAAGLTSVQLDSGMHREGAHRFYDREGFARAGYHFSKTIGEAATAD